MNLQQLRKIAVFYSRFTPSFSAIGYYARRPFWQNVPLQAEGKTWLVTGASGGIGGEVVRQVAGAGGRVLAVARNQGKLDALVQSLEKDAAALVVPMVCDLSLMRDTARLVRQLAAVGEKIDVLVNNVGILQAQLSVTEENLELSFATNLLNHFLLTEGVISNDTLASDAVVVNVSSGGMYNQPLRLDMMNNQSATYSGVVAYGQHKRAQVALTDYWRRSAHTGQRTFYVMHPGWSDTGGVRTGMPRFRKILKSVLRDELQGADTILWLASKRPAQPHNDLIWFDRKIRPAHIYAHTSVNQDSPEALADYLAGFCSEFTGVEAPSTSAALRAVQ
ncbi:SDR family NAD(P)-dependent oxidoreductase [Seongchinamella sediminis]|uniref:SDR family NAD(P)-dependent oxidoreductase n=1 Tax=Seongchinamella sediminis TaxID=2283635 RepID=UPI0013C2E1C2|nr:SDR family NAD(P)-dependent oxidoreductase [Seongchinamella sediminis]